MTWWIDAGAGASGDMLLGALLDLDPDGLDEVRVNVDEVLARLGAGGEVRIRVESTRRAGMVANRALVECADSTTSRTWRDIEPALAGNPTAHRIFRELARAEAAVHGTTEAAVHFHEVGALDAIADVVGIATLWDRLAPSGVVVSPVCVGSGSVRTAHGSLSVPAPAVARLLSGKPTFGGPIAHEACTPTGAAALVAFAEEWGPQPPMSVQSVGIGAGGRDPAEQPNVLRIFRGIQASAVAQKLVMVETTIDDLDPRLYPDVMAATKAAGALEAWLTPVIMKHGRPATTLSALTPRTATDAVARVIFEQTSTLGVRMTDVDRYALTRDLITVEVLGMPVSVKRGWFEERITTIQPEYRDVAAVARTTGRPVADVMRLAERIAAEMGQKKGSDATDGGDSDVRTTRT